MAAKTSASRRSETAQTNGLALMRLIHTVTARNERRATMDLSIRERLIIQRLGIEGSLTINALGQRLGVTPSSMTGIVDRLEANRYLKRQPHPADRRATVLTLARKGATAFGREVAFYDSLLHETLDPLGAEARQLVLHALSTLAPATGSEDAA